MGINEIMWAQDEEGFSKHKGNGRNNKGKQENLTVEKIKASKYKRKQS